MNIWYSRKRKLHKAIEKTKNHAYKTFSRRIFRYCSYKHYFAEWAENFSACGGLICLKLSNNMYCHKHYFVEWAENVSPAHAAHNIYIYMYSMRLRNVNAVSKVLAEIS